MTAFPAEWLFSFPHSQLLSFIVFFKTFMLWDVCGVKQE